MLNLDKNHDPYKNATLIERYSHHNLTNVKTAIQITDKIFEKLLNHPVEGPPSSVPFATSLIKKVRTGLARFGFAKSSQTKKIPYQTVVDENAIASPEWKFFLDIEERRLHKQITNIVNVTDFGAIGDGKTDNTEAFKKALGKGRVKVRVPEGVFVTKGIILPSWSCLVGAGKGKTFIKLSSEAPKKTRLLTNSGYCRGNHHILVEEMSLNWNVERLSDEEKTFTWGNYSSCLTFANVTYGWVKNVEAINPGLHGFDVSSPYYDYSGDGNRARGGSRFIWLDGLNSFGFGDDGITTHHSENIFISNCHMCDPSGRAHNKGFSNSNGIEIDDGSKHVWLVNNSTTRCFGGLEIKAHHNSSAGNNVQIIGHLSINDNRSYNFRHIGHHKRTETNSLTAFNIQATNLISFAPIYTDLYKDSTPRSMVISAYQNVVINGFTLIGNEFADYHGHPMIAIQYKARNVCLHNVFIADFHKAGSDIRIFGGDQHADHIELKNIKVEHSSPIAIDIGNHVDHVSIANVKASTQNGKHVIKAFKKLENLSNLSAKGYSTPVYIQK